MKKLFSLITLISLTGLLFLPGCTSTGSKSNDSDVKLSDLYTYPQYDRNGAAFTMCKKPVPLNDRPLLQTVIVLGYYYIIHEINAQGNMYVKVEFADLTRKYYTVSRTVIDQLANKQITNKQFYDSITVTPY